MTRRRAPKPKRPSRLLAAEVHKLEATRGLSRSTLPLGFKLVVHATLAVATLLWLILRELVRIRKILDTRLPGPTTSVGLTGTPVPKGST